MKYSTLIIGFSIYLFGFSSFGLNEKTQSMDALLVYGDSFLFSVKEPKGWKCSCDNQLISKYSANAICYRAGVDPLQGIGVIRIRLNPKTDENIDQDLKADQESYKSQFKSVQFKDLKINSTSLKYVASVFFVTGQFYEYTAYLNPGRSFKMMFSVSMNEQGKEAPSEDLSGLDYVASSLKLISDNLKKK